MNKNEDVFILINTKWDKFRNFKIKNNKLEIVDYVIFINGSLNRAGKKCVHWYIWGLVLVKYIKIGYLSEI